MKNRRPLRRLAVLQGFTARYSGIQSAYCVLICAATGFVTVFLLENGVTINQVGFVLATINGLSVLTQVILGNLVGGGKRISLRAAVAFMCGIAAVSSLALLLILGRSQAMLLVTFVASAVLTSAMQPLITSIAMEYVNGGYALDFGFARGLGSVAYAVAAFFLGKIVARNGAGFMPGVHAGVAAITMALVLLFPSPTRRAHIAPAIEEATPEEAPQPEDDAGETPHFYRRHARFFAMLGGVACITLCARVVSTYLIKIIEGIGGDSASLGLAVALAALVEFPMMAGYGRLRRRLGNSLLLRVSAVFYTVKAAAIIFAGSIPMLYAAHLVQFFGYAMFLPAFTFYINQIMGEKDKVRGQTLGVAAMTTGDVLGALMCGVIPATVPMKTVLLIGAVISAAGSILVVLLTKTIREEAV